jgi:hypothetical protein
VVVHSAGTCHQHRVGSANDRNDSYQKTERLAALVGAFSLATRRQAMSTTTSRRAVLAGAAATLPAVAVLPSLTAAAAANPDAELIALGVQLEPIAEEWLVLNDAEDLSDDEIDARCDAVDGRLFPLAEHILSLKAQTVAGLAVQVRAITMVATCGMVLILMVPTTRSMSERSLMPSAHSLGSRPLR